MPLRPARELIEDAVRRGYALPYFESWSLESLQGVVDAVEETRSPAILGFNGDFLSAPDRASAERLEWYAALGRAAAESAAVPCALLFNECPRDGWVLRALQLGFNMVMPVPSAAPYEEAARRVREVVCRARLSGAAVEGELGELPLAAGSGVEGGELTDPELAARFVEETGVDLLAVSVGNVHIRTRGHSGLDLERLAAIRRRTGIPLALHGGSGIEPGALRAAIRLGVAKVNFGTYVKQRYLAALRAGVAREEPNPHRLLGMGGPEDLLAIGRRAVREAVLERLPLLGCAGEA